MQKNALNHPFSDAFILMFLLFEVNKLIICFVYKTLTCQETSN